MQSLFSAQFRSTACAVVACLVFGASACDRQSQSLGSQLPVGSIQNQPGGTLKFVVDASSNGQAPALRLLRAEWGRLVDVYDYNALTQTRTRIFADFLVGPDIATDGLNYVLERLPGTGRELLVIQHPYGSVGFDTAYQALDDALQSFIVKGLAVNELPPFTAAPRNSALRLVFDDLLDPATVSAETIQLAVGYPPTNEQGARVFADPNYGDLVGGAFRSTRVVVDLTVSQDEAASLGLPVNSVGLPEAVTPNQANAVLRIPTRPVPGVLVASLSNLSGSTVGFTGNGATDPTAPTLDIVRAFRSGGRTSVTLDPNNGFLPDPTAPSIVSSQPISLQSVAALGDDYLFDAVFQTPACALQPRQGDIIALSNGIYLRLLLDGPAPVGNVASGLIGELIDQVFPGVSVSEGAVAQYRQRWTGSSDQSSRPGCWVTILPAPATPPAAGLATGSTFTIQFSEPINPASVSGFDSFQLQYGFPTDGVIQSRVVGTVTASSDLTRYTFQPRLPLRHATAQTETYRLSIGVGTDGVLDLSGNALDTTLRDGLGALPAFQIAATQVPIESRSVSLQFSSTDEDALPTDPPGAPEFRGQLIYDLLNSRIRPRSVARVSGVFESQTPSAQRMPGPDVIARPPLLQPNGSIIGIAMNPLTRLGARTMTVWRYLDMGMSVAIDWDAPTQSFDDDTFNLDVEGLWWSPSSAGVLVDNFPEFEMRLSHSKFLPDEVLAMGAPVFPLSGLADNFADNVLDPVNDPQKVVHPRGLGFTINPVDQSQTSNGTILAPWPLNRDIPASQYQYYTWRDTAIQAVGQPLAGGGQGVYLGNEALILNFPVCPPPPMMCPDPPPPPIYQVGLVPSIGLPLLMDIRCYPNTSSSQSNRPNGRCAVPVALDQYPNAFALETSPWFTVYSGGAVTLGGVLEPVQPDLEIIARGTNPPGGTNCLPHNQIALYGQGDFVVRVSRAHSRWFQCATTGGAAFDFAEPVIEPSVSELPAGTQVLLHFRGATTISIPGGGPATPWFDARNLDPYGDRNPLNATPAYNVTFLNNDATWKSSMSEIDGSNFFQTRITLISNAESGATPEISGLGFAFAR